MAAEGPTVADARHAPPARAERRASPTEAGPSEAPAGGVEAAILRLQGSAGNRATAALLAGAQTKLTVGPAGDAFEREADDVAGRVVRSMFSGTAPGDTVSTPVQRLHASGAAASGARRSATSGSARDAQVGAAGGEVASTTAARIATARSGGEPMDPEVRSRFETSMGADFSDVRLHAGGAADDLNRQLGARAFTVGRDVFFGGGVPDTGSREGASLVAHELAHVVQQGGAEVQRSPAEYIQRDATATATVLTPGQAMVVDTVTATVIEAELGAARATLLRYLSRGLGVGGARFWRSAEVRQFRQGLKEAARQRAKEDISALAREAANQNTDGELTATQQYLTLFAKGEAYGASKESVDGEMADYAETWLLRNFDVQAEQRRDQAARQIHAAILPILAPGPYDLKRLVKAEKLGSELADKIIGEFTEAKRRDAEEWKNALVKPDQDDASAVDASESTRLALANEVKVRTTRDEIGRKSLEKSVRANTTDEGMGIIGKLLDKAIPQPGDTVSIAVELKIPIPDTPAFVLLNFEGQAGRGITGFTTSGVATLGDSKRLEVMAEFSIGAGVGADLVGVKFEGSASVGFFVRAGSDAGTFPTMKALSYGAYRSACDISRQFGNWWAGSGNGVDEQKEHRAEIWAAMIEEQVFTEEGNAFADVGGSSKAAAGAKIGAAGALNLEVEAELAMERFTRYDRNGLKASLGDDVFAKQVADKAAARDRRETAEGSRVHSFGFSSGVDVAIAGQSVGFGLSFSGEKSGGEDGGFFKNWGAEITASLSVPAGATDRVAEIAAGIVGGAASGAQNIAQMVQKGAAKDGPGSAVGAGLDTSTDIGRILNAGLENKISDGLNKAWTKGGEGVLSAESKLEAVLTFGLSGGDFVVRFELRETKSLKIDTGIGNAGIKVEATRGKRLLGLEYKRAPSTDTAETKNVGHWDVEALGLRPRGT